MLMVNINAFSASALGTEQTYVYDNANLLSDFQEATLQREAEAFAAKNISVVFVTTNDAKGYLASSYASRFYDERDFYDDGILFLIDLDNREIYIDTVGGCISTFTDYHIDKMLDRGMEYIYSDYYKVFESMFEYAKPKLSRLAVNLENPNYHFWQKVKDAAPEPDAILIIIIITVVVVVVLILKHKRRTKNVSTKQYLSADDGFVVNNRNDIYITSRVNVIHGYYNRSSSSGGRSRSGGGGGGRRSHGGGGRRF